MLHSIAGFAHILGALLMGAGLIGVWLADVRARQASNIDVVAELVRCIATFYDGLVLPGALLLLASGGWMVATVYGGTAAFQIPWLSGMIVLFAIEFVEGNTVTRVHFRRMLRLVGPAAASGILSPALERELKQPLATWTHFVDLPLLALIIALGTLRPDRWETLLVALVAALAVGTALSLWIPRLYPWRMRDSGFWS